MALTAGIVGLPNVGKSTLFNYISFKSTFDMMKQGGFKEVKNGKFEELK